MNSHVVAAKAVVLAAGAIQTPAILMRSGLRTPHLGQHLQLHPTALAIGGYDEPVFPWRGLPQSIVCEEFASLTTSEGFRLETTPLHPGFAAMALTWADGFGHRESMCRLNHLSGLIALLQDRDEGAVRCDRKGQAIVDYRISKPDYERLVKGVCRALQCHRAAGATRFELSLHRPLTVTAGDVDHPDQLASRIHSLGNAGLCLYSAHQMSTCRMSEDPREGVTCSFGQIHDRPGLYVADASLCPTATGVNPMITIMGLAQLVSRNLAENWVG